MPVRYHIVFPVGRLVEYGKLTDCARSLVDAACNQAEGFAGQSVKTLIVRTNERSVWRLSDGTRLRLSKYFVKGIHVLMNVGFLLSDTPQISPLIRKAKEAGMAFSGTRSSRDIHAFALSVRTLPFFFTRAWRKDKFWSALSCLAACIDDETETAWRDIAFMPFLPPDKVSVENSPAMRHMKDLRCRRRYNAPSFLNTAIKEILSNPQDQGYVGHDPLLMSHALLEQRSASRVPWIFNTLLNEIDYRLGSDNPLSFPPEIHLSTTGVCNIECRFCDYTHGVARPNFTTTSQVSRMDFLRYVQTLRLGSGLGEPTINEHLPSIVNHVSKHFPHISMNFFTNGINLNHTLAKELVGKVHWINASLNASNRKSWKAQCNSDKFAHVCNNLGNLLKEKRARRSLWPLVYGSMVLNRENIADLPRMPAFCRELGVDRFTAFPYFALGYNSKGKFGPDMTLEACRETYDDIYMETIREAEANGITIEIPGPSGRVKTGFGLELRTLKDFALIEANEWPFSRFLKGLKFEKPPGTYCHFLWRYAAIGNTNNSNHSPDETHFIYPCIGPLSSVDLSRRTAFRFPGGKGFMELWGNSILTLLRRAQHESGICEVCDLCKKKNTRDPRLFKHLENLVGQFQERHSDVGPENGLGTWEENQEY